MAITEQQFKEAQKGDILVDAYGHQWEVRSKGLLPDEPFPTLLVRYEPDGRVEELMWSDGKIVDEEFGILVELNHPNAKFIKADAVSSDGFMKEVRMSFRYGHRFDVDSMMLNLCCKGGFFVDNKGGGDYVITQKGKITLEEFFTPENIKQLEAGGVTITIIN